MLKVTSDWYIDIENGRYTAMICIDLTKAFDTVDHQILLNKIQFYAITGHAHKWFSSFALKKAKATKYAGDTAILHSSDTSDELDLGINEEFSCIENSYRAIRFPLMLSKPKL